MGLHTFYTLAFHKLRDYNNICKWIYGHADKVKKYYHVHQELIHECTPGGQLSLGPDTWMCTMKSVVSWPYYTNVHQEVSCLLALIDQYAPGSQLSLGPATPMCTRKSVVSLSLIHQCAPGSQLSLCHWYTNMHQEVSCLFVTDSLMCIRRSAVSLSLIHQYAPGSQLSLCPDTWIYTRKSIVSWPWYLNVHQEVSVSSHRYLNVNKEVSCLFMTDKTMCNRKSLWHWYTIQGTSINLMLLYDWYTLYIWYCDLHVTVVFWIQSYIFKN